MSDTKRYRVCKRCRGSNRIVSDDHGGIAECPDCGHGDCAPGVVDAGVVWSREWPERGEWWAWHPERCPTVQHCAVEYGWLNFGPGYGDRSTNKNDGRWQFTPYTIPAPPKE